MASAEIDVFKREVLERGGKLAEELRAGKEPDDAAALREVMNTVGKAGCLGESIRCVVSVSMLTEGWDANTVTHVLGVRAFGTQLLCEQVIGRALRRQSYELNNDGLFNVECADVLGIPFDFNAEPVVAPPQKPREALADTACERITAGIVRAELAKERPIQAVLDPYNPTGSTRHVGFNTTKTERWETDAGRCHVTWVVLDSEWEAEFCRVAEQHPRVRAT